MVLWANFMRKCEILNIPVSPKMKRSAGDGMLADQRMLLYSQTWRKVARWQAEEMVRLKDTYPSKSHDHQ
jgi:hypothetical protein